MSETSRDRLQVPSADGRDRRRDRYLPDSWPAERSGRAGVIAGWACAGWGLGIRHTGSPETRAQARHVPTGDATGAAGGYGTGSERSSGGSGEGRHDAGDDPETDWLREAPGTPSDG